MNDIKKIYFTISEVAKDCNVESHTIRFWLDKSEIGQLIGEVKRTSRNRRKFTQEQKTFLKEVSRLRYLEGYTLPGTVNFIKRNL